VVYVIKSGWLDVECLLLNKSGEMFSDPPRCRSELKSTLLPKVGPK
jgi:hypothetical protein